MNGPVFRAELFEGLPIVGILRGVPSAALGPLMQAVRAGGLRNLEITMNTPGAAAQIEAACRLAGPDLNVGAGTVTSVRLYEEARAAGASFIVTPTLLPAVLERCANERVPVFPGAFSPSEIQRAWEAGATMVKVFPADALGPAYFRSLREQVPEARLMPTGGVNLCTLTSYAQAGAAGFGVGTPLFRPERIAAGEWDWVRNQCRAFVEAYLAAKQPAALQSNQP